MMAAKRLVPYARISRRAGREKRGEAFIAEKNYREQVDRWAEGKDVTLLPWHCDFDQSGRKLRGRPKLNAVMELIRSGEADGVVTPEASRFSRAGLRDALDLIAAIREHGAAFVPLDVPGAEDPDNADAEMALNIWLAVAHRQLRKHEQQWETGKRRAVLERGVPISRAAIGYRHDWRDGDPALGSKGLVKVPGEATDALGATPPPVTVHSKLGARRGPCRSSFRDSKPSGRRGPRKRRPSRPPWSPTSGTGACTAARLGPPERSAQPSGP